MICLNLPYYAYSKYYDKWCTPSDNLETMQFAVRRGKLICMVWGSKEDQYNIVEVIENFITEKEWLEKYSLINNN